MDSIEKAVEIFKNKHNCCQAVVIGFAEHYGMDPEIAKRIGRAFGSGMGRLGLVCGAISGALMVIGLSLEASQDENQAKKKAAELTREFVQRFLDRHDTILCKELIGADMLTDEGWQKIEREKPFETLCPQLVRSAAEICKSVLNVRDNP